MLENNRKCLLSIYLMVLTCEKTDFICFSLDKWILHLITKCYKISKSSFCSNNGQQLSNEINIKSFK